MLKRSQHIIRNPDGGWAVKKGGSTRATKIHNTQAEAITHGRRIARSQKTELYIHDRGGKVREKDCYGKDPYPPKG